MGIRGQIQSANLFDSLYKEVLKVTIDLGKQLDNPGPLLTKKIVKTFCNSLDEIKLLNYFKV